MERQQSTYSQEVRLWETAQERDRIETEADLYAVFKATDALEKANQSTELEQAQYLKHFDKLNSSFRSIRQGMQSVDALDQTGDAGAPSKTHFDKFMETYDIARTMPKAKVRLVDEGRVTQQVQRSAQGSAKFGVIASTTHQFIALTDALQLEGDTIAVDEVQPLISDLLNELDKLPPGVFDSWSGTADVKRWTTRLIGMRASDELNADDKRQLQFEIDRAYNEFHTKLDDM
jgi:ESCRT-I complex subunit VPS28